MNKKSEKDRHKENNQAADGKDQPAITVGIGVGTGGSKSLKKLLPNLPAGQDTAYILIRHQEAAGKDLTVRQLKNLTGLPVMEAEDGMPVLADRLYVVPVHLFLSIRDGKLTMKSPMHCNGLWMPIDHFFCSLATDRLRHACGLVLSGSGSDGVLGLSEIKAAGGWAIVEDPQNAKHPGMSQIALDAGVTNQALPVETMAAELAALAKRVKEEARTNKTRSGEPSPDLAIILAILHIKAGHDFRCYKTATILRRVQRRMSLSNIGTLTDYARFLEENPEEVELLQKDLQIGVTEFFRQPQAWEILEEKVIIPLVERTQPGAAIRVWVPGCSTGQEAYSLAMMLTRQAEKSGKDLKIQVFATDSEESALAAARMGSYSDEDIGEGVPPEYLKRFFTRKDRRFQIIKAIREQIVFAPQNITTDPPFSRIDLISCRNLLMYLEQRVQQKIFAIFHFALREGGFLFLGSAETIGERTDLFEPVSKKWRIYRRFGVGRSLGVDIPAHPGGGIPSLFTRGPVTPAAPRITLASTAQQVLMDRFAPACVMIDRKLQVLYVHGAIEEYLTFPTGELTMNVVDMAREGLRTRLRGAIGKCAETGRLVPMTARVRRGKKSVPVKATVSPLRYPRSADGLLLVTFEDQRLPAVKSRRNMAEDSDIRQMEDELKIIREELQSTIEQLEGSNDLLKASNEEVTAANEELQAGNEELETSKEELQSLNEELNTSNTRLHDKVEELENTNDDIVNLLSSTSIATLFLDKALRIKRFTPSVTSLFSLIPSDCGRSIADVLRRFIDEALLDDARRVLTDLTPAAREVQADDGRWYMRRVTPYRTQDDRIEGVVITFVDFTERKRADDALNEARLRQAVILDSIADGFFALDRDWRFMHINDSALGHFSKKRDEVMGRKLFDVFPDSRGTIFESEYRRAMATGAPVHFEAPSILGGKILEVYAYPRMDNLTVLFRDITQQHQMAETLNKAHERTRWLARFPEENPNPIVRVSAEGNVLYCNPASASDSSWKCKKDEPLPDVFLALVAQAMTQQEEAHQEIQLGKRFYGITVMPFPEEAYANVYGREITKRKLAEQALQESERRVRLKLESILSPEGDIGNLELADIIDIESVRSMLADFSALANIPVAIIDLTGKVLVGEAWQDICTQFHRVHKEACKHCIESDTELTTGVPPGESRLYKCKNNMWDVSTPIIVGGKHMGNVFSGQFFFADEPVDHDSFRAQARRYGFDEEAYLRALDAVPRISKEFLNTAMSFLMKLADTVSRQSYSNIKLARSLAERDALMASLKESEERLRLFIEHAPASLAMFDRDMRYLGVSRRWRTDYGLGDREFAGLSLYEVFPEIPAEWKEVHRRGLAGEVLHGEADRLDRADGSVQWVQWEVRPWYNAAGAIGGIVIFTEDITARKQAEDILQRYRLLAEHTHDIVLFIARMDGRILEANQAAIRSYGYTREELLSLSIGNIRIPGDAEKVTEAQMAEAEEKGILFETVHRRKDGSMFPVEVSSRGAVISDTRVLISVVRNIAERRASEETIRLSVERLRRAQEIAHLGSWELELAGNRLTWSDEVYRIFGLAPQEFGATYEAFLERVHPADRDAVKTAYSLSLSENRDTYEIEHRIVRKDTGEIRIVLERCQHFRDASGAIIRSGGMVHDITDRKRAESLLLKKTEQLEAANKELESFSYTVSHDLRAPLRAIDGYSRMIQKKYADRVDGDVLEKLNVIRSSTQMMGQLIDDLLAFSRLGRAQLSKTKLNMDELIRAIWQDVAGSETQRRMEFRVPELPPGLGDGGLIRQVLVNLLENAVKFTKRREQTVIEAGGYATNGESVYYIRDNGVGFDMKYYNKLFGVFQRLHLNTDFEGTGVGLAIVQRIIHRHGGRVWAEGEVDQGATFFFTLPEA